MMNKILLHCCCAPCSCVIIEHLLAEGLTPTLYFYNPNIHPIEEYLKRKLSLSDYLNKKHIEFIDADYDPEQWFIRIKGFEKAPERGVRCSMCFDMRLERTALYANENGFLIFATTNAFGRQKDISQVNASGHRAAFKYKGLIYLDTNWRKDNAAVKAAFISNNEGFYRQSYCGCLYSNKKTLHC